MNFIQLTYWDLSLAALLLLLLALATHRVGLGGRMLWSGVRTVVQLSLIGVVLESLFAHRALHWVALMALIMLIAAGYEVWRRQARRFRGWSGYGIGSLSMFLSSFTVTLLALITIVQPEPWYTPQYAIPLLGMLLGNTMNGISLALDALTKAAWRDRAVIEGRLALGHSWQEAIAAIQQDALRTGLIPITNAMAAAGLISLPGMMTGQILAGAPPADAVKYQILIMFLIAAGSGFGSYAALWLGARRLFDTRERLRLDRLSAD